MEFEKVLTKRVSTRKYNDKMPSNEDIKKVIDAALLAPIVHLHKFHISVVTSKDAMNLAEDAADVIFAAPEATIKMPRPYLYNAPVWIILSGKIHDESEMPKAQADLMNVNLFWDVGTIIENMELQATALGLAHCGINTTVVAMRGRPDVRKALDIPEGFDALASVIIGYTDLELQERKVKPELIPVSYVK
ncbi:MAG: nitroreductase family protein [Synergistaceae bacterium]|nr:nitroreductase family protein [Synergistaceae bacterium]